MKRRTKAAVAGVIVAAAAAIGGGVAVAGAADDGDTPITGEALIKASEAAINHVGGGQVTETEAGDEDGAYEVEVRRDDGSQVEVLLDSGFQVLAVGDDDTADDRDDADD